MRLVLASKSASRAALLRGAAVSFEMEGAGADEDASKRRMAGESPRDIAGALAAEKALAVAARTEGLVIGADQTLELDGRDFPMPPRRSGSPGSLDSDRLEALLAGMPPLCRFPTPPPRDA